MPHSRSKKSRLARVGDDVAFDHAGLTVTGSVVEDRGHIGVGGRRLVRVRIEMGAGVDPMFTELPDEALSIVKRVA